MQMFQGHAMCTAGILSLSYGEELKKESKAVMQKKGSQRMDWHNKPR
jgi:hypothetical protein